MSYFVRTFKRRKIFLDQLAVGESLSSAARAAGGSTKNFKNWRDSDPEFAADWDEALEEGTDFIEDVATQRAIKKSDPLMAMILKARRPDKYDRGGRLELSGSIGVEGSKAKLLNRIARLQATGAISAASDTGQPQISEDRTEEDTQQLPAPEETKLLPAPGVIRGRKRRAAAGGGGREQAA